MGEEAAVRSRSGSIHAHMTEGGNCMPDRDSLEQRAATGCFRLRRRRDGIGRQNVLVVLSACAGAK